MKSIMIVRLNPAITAYNASEEAIPRPDKKPDFQFLFTVRFMQSIPSGPSGTETAMPIIKPFHRRLKFMAAKIVEKMIFFIQNQSLKTKFAAILPTFIRQKL